MKRTPIHRKTTIRRKSAKKATCQTSDALAHIAAVKTLPCVITGLMGVDAHHCQSGRYGSARRSDYAVIPLHPSAHRQEYGPGAYHYSKRSWEERHGPDYCFLPRVYAMLGKEMPEEIKEVIDEKGLPIRQ